MDFKKILISSVVLTVLDLVWLKFYMTDKYVKMIKLIQKEDMKVKILYALFAYLTLCFAVNYFVPDSDENYYIKNFLLGLSIYGVYDFTCAAIFKNWDIELMIQDIIWGGILFSSTRYLTKEIEKLI